MNNFKRLLEDSGLKKGDKVEHPSLDGQWEVVGFGKDNTANLKRGSKKVSVTLDSIKKV